jgi:hypothetical protein
MINFFNKNIKSQKRSPSRKGLFLANYFTPQQNSSLFGFGLWVKDFLVSSVGGDKLNSKHLHDFKATNTS